MENARRFVSNIALIILMSEINTYKESSLSFYCD